MSERRLVLVLVAVTLIIGVSGVVLIGYLPSLWGEDVYVESYKATLYVNGTLEEEYVYSIQRRGFRFLFRTWDVPLSTISPGHPYVEPVSIDAVDGSVAYFKTYQGEVRVDESYETDESIISRINDLAEVNEAGVFSSDSYDIGFHKVRFVFQIHPPLEYDEDWVHLNLKLADRHLRYKSVEILFPEAEYVREVFPHPPSLEVERGLNRVVVTGSSGKDQLLEVELLLNRGILQAFDGFPERLESVEEKTLNSNRITSIQYYGAVASMYASEALVLLMPALLYLVYHRYGREEEYTVPTYLSTIPNRNRKPWVVNQIFEDTALDYDDDGFYATLLDLHNRDKIDINAREGGFVIRILDSDVEDSYERKVIHFLEDLASNGVVDTARIEWLTQRIQKGGAGGGSLARKIRGQLVEITTYVDEEVASRFIVRGKRRILPLLVLSVLLLLFSIAQLFYTQWIASVLVKSTLFSIVAMAQTITAFLFPPSFFGKWREDAYREKLEWDAFARHLDDFARINDAPPRDISIWGEWLVYGTALGVGESVSRAMRELKIDLPELAFYPLLPVYFHPLVVATAPSRGNVSGMGVGGSVGGGFGAGGGFGGGGAGAR